MTVLKWLAKFVLVVVLCYAGWIALSLYRLPPVAQLADRKASLSIEVQDSKGKLHPFVVGPENRYWVPAERIPAEMEWAVVVAEDANFYEHKGIDVKAIKNAIKYDLEKKRFARGASTITQQTAKNLFLSRKKTITRKLEEIYLATRMEQELTKGRILELYLNIVELGPMVYGVGHGARYYFEIPAESLSPRQAAFLAAMLPGPQKAYNPYRHMDRVLKRSDLILRLLRQRGVLTEAEYRQALEERVDIAGMQRKVDRSFTGKVRRFFKNLFGF